MVFLLIRKPSSLKETGYWAYSRLLRAIAEEKVGELMGMLSQMAIGLPLKPHSVLWA